MGRSLEAVFLNPGNVFLTRDVWQCLEIILVGGGGAPDIQWVEARNAVKHPTMHRRGPQNNYYQPKMSTALLLRSPELGDCLSGLRRTECLSQSSLKPSCIGFLSRDKRCHSYRKDKGKKISVFRKRNEEFLP